MMMRLGMGAAVAALLLSPALLGLWSAAERCDISPAGPGYSLSANPHGCPVPIHHHHRDGGGCAPAQLLGLSQPSCARDGGDLAPPAVLLGNDAAGSPALPASSYSVLLPAARAPPV